jgi:uncharacterized lipoprotein YddW (UPF0748 family)
MKKILLFCIFLQYCLTSFAQPKRELRAAWIATFTNIDWPVRTQTPAQQQAGLNTILTHHMQTGTNAVYLQVRSQCDALYPSNIEPWSADLTGTQGKAPNPLWDPLQFAIDEAHKRGMELHAWLNPYRAASNINSIAGFHASHVSKAHPEWTINVSTSATTTVQILNPGMPQVRDYITSVVVDIVNRYDVDGIHFDDYFYPQPRVGASINDDAAYEADPRGFPNTTAGRADWRRDNVNLLIQRVNDTIKALKPWVKFGVSPTGIYRNSTNPAIGTPTAGLEHYTTLYCDSRKWLQEGWIDYLAPQVYWYIGQPGADYSKIVPWWNDNANGRHIYIGMAGYKVNDPAQGAAWANPSMIPNEVRLNRSYANIQGQAIYNTSSLRSTTKLGFRDSLRLGFYNRAALLPLMPWKDDAPPQPATALSAVKYDNDSVVLNWIKPEASANEMDKAKRFVIYRSTGAVIDINDANNILFITPFDTTAFRDTAIAPNTTYYYTVTSIDRLHNESEASNTAANIPPSITCPGDQLLDLNNSCSVMLPDYTGMAVVNNNQPSASPIVVTQSPAAGTVIIGTRTATVTLTATDKAGNASVCSFEVSTHDVTAPVITAASANPDVLFPPNHKMKMVTLSYKVEDNCGATASLSVSSNEPVGAEDDWQVIDATHVKLRAEREGSGTGRIYTITITATDAAGNTNSTPVTVLVPHDNGHDNTIVARNAEPGKIADARFSVEVLGNPGHNYFIVTPRSSTAVPVTMVIIDNLGRVVEQRNGMVPNITIQVGTKYAPGIYYAEFRQGQNRNYVKLVKQ